MPHKRAKQSVRTQTQKEAGMDMAPGKDSLRTEAIPKSALRVLDALKIREDFRVKKRKNEGDAKGENDLKHARKRGKTSEDNGRTSGLPTKQMEKKKTNGSYLTIKPGESIQHFNERVENDMRPLVNAAVHTSYIVARKTRRLEAQAKKRKKIQTKASSVQNKEDTSSPPEVDKHANKPKEFQELSTAAPRRLNDIVKAPPEFKHTPRGVGKSGGFGSGDGVLSMAQKVMMAQEREKAIVRYRQLKERRKSLLGE